jgi:translation initiation factor eIF-2B subunit epsilon
MGVQRKGANRVSEDPVELTRVPLQAILLADSFATKFRPITLERPKVISLSLSRFCVSTYVRTYIYDVGIYVLYE